MLLSRLDVHQHLWPEPFLAALERRIAPPFLRRPPAGPKLVFAASDIHRVRHGGAGPAVSIHAYSSPLWRMGAYEVGAGGELRRHSISYAEELRPLAATV